jgi:molybdate transport system substrate-binding protein
MMNVAARMRLVALCAVGLMLVACAVPADGRSTSPEPVRSAEPLLVLAASDLQFALAEVAERFETEANQPVTFVFGSTGNLAHQIEQGAPADVFFAANESFVDNLERRGHLLEGTRQVYAIGRIVLTRAAGTTIEVTTLEHLLPDEIRTVAIANPEHAPYGMAAKQALETAGLWERVRPKLVLGENISQAFQFVQTGNADAGIVALSVALGVPGTDYALIDAGLHAPLVQAAAVIGRTPQPAAAHEFLVYVNGPVGRPIMERHGFVLPERP